MNEAADQRLVDAVQAGDEVAVGQALADGADPNVTVGRFRGSVLAEAARGGRRGIVSLLMDAGARIGNADPYTPSPLRAAVLEAHTEVVESLVAHWALTVESASRSSVLTEAVSHTAFRPTPAAFATLRVLLEAGAATGPSEEAPLIKAVMRSVAPAVLRLLLAHGADADQRRSDDTPVIVVAARRGELRRGGRAPAGGCRHERPRRAGADGVDARGRTRRATGHCGPAAGWRRHRRGQRRRHDCPAIGPWLAATERAVHVGRALRRSGRRADCSHRRPGRSDRRPTRRRSADAPPVGGRPRHGSGRPRRRRVGDSDGRGRRYGTGVAVRLREEVVPAANASWHQLDVTADELAAVRSALVELAYGTTRVMPAGASRLEIIDVLEELNRQLGR